jgi:hypothetical protein
VKWEDYVFDIRHVSGQQLRQGIAGRVMNAPEFTLYDTGGNQVDFDSTRPGEIYQVARTVAGRKRRTVMLASPEREGTRIAALETEDFNEACCSTWGPGNWNPYTEGGSMRRPQDLVDGPVYIVVKGGEDPPEVRGGRHRKSHFSCYDEEHLGQPIRADREESLSRPETWRTAREDPTAGA